ncbi:hypothetical protein KCP71_02075 [Salmonella enterica subsp. enterica]|nr:hypothetical protein KCP71_02075 [Salmonella enterica subsp. enterica]
MLAYLLVFRAVRCVDFIRFHPGHMVHLCSGFTEVVAFLQRAKSHGHFTVLHTFVGLIRRSRHQAITTGKFKGELKMAAHILMQKRFR